MEPLKGHAAAIEAPVGRPEGGAEAGPDARHGQHSPPRGAEPTNAAGAPGAPVAAVAAGGDVGGAAIGVVVAMLVTGDLAVTP